MPEQERGTLVPRIIRGMVGRDIDSLYPERNAEIGEEILRIEDWHVGDGCGFGGVGRHEYSRAVDRRLRL